MATTLLEQRRIEAAIVAPIVRAITARWGEAAAEALLTEVIEGAAFAAGQALRREWPEGTLAAFAAIWDRFAEGGALEVSVVERRPERLHLRVTRCRYAEQYAAAGLGPLGAILSCRRDHALTRGYSDRIRLERPATLLEGAPACEFIFTEDEVR